MDPEEHCAWLFDHESGNLFQRNDEGFLEWTTDRTIRTGVGAQHYHCVGTSPSPPPSVSAATVTKVTATQVSLDSFTCHGVLLAPPPIIPTPTLASHCSKLHDGDRWAVEDIKSSDEGFSVASLISDKEAIEVSDGSHQGPHSASAFIITRRKQQGAPFSNVTGSNVVPGTPAEQDSYRAELGGLMGLVTALEVLCSLHKITSGAIELGLDGEGAYKAIFVSGPPQANDKAYDLLRAIRTKIACLPITVTGRHIKGHRDEEVAYYKLNRWERLNVQMDKAAKRRLAAAKQNPPAANRRLGVETLAVYFQGQKLSDINKPALYQEIYGKRTKARWVQLHKIPTHLVDNNIAWEALHTAFKREPLGKRRWLCKHCAKQCGVGKSMLRRKHQHHARCPRCDIEVEDTTHVITCKATSAYSHWVDATNCLHDWMINEGTNPQLADVIISRLGAWRAKDPLQPVTRPVALMPAMAEQDEIGWENFILGRISTKWVHFQQVHYQNCHSCKMGSAWAAKLIRQLWLVVWKMWQHRNNINTSTLTAQQKRDRAHLLGRVNQEFAKGKSTLLKEDQHLLKHKEEVKKYPNVDLEDWLTQVKNARAANARMVAKESRALQASQRLMQAWRTGGHKSG